MDTIAASIAGGAERFGDSAALTFKTTTGWSSVTYTELDVITSELGRGFIDLGVEAGDRVCILADTRVEWTYADYALVRAGVIVVPIYASNSPEECAWVIGNSGARVVICENAAQAAKVATVRADLPTLETVVTIEPTEEYASLDDLRVAGRALAMTDLDARTAAVRPDDVWSIIYTSGTTGPAKGCMLTHAGMAAVCAAVQADGLLNEKDRSFLFLPLAHLFARIVQLLATELGGSVIYFGGDVKKVLDDLAETKPTFLPSVPRIFEKIYTKAWASARESGGAKLAIFSWAVGVGRQLGRAQQDGRSPSLLLKLQHAVADRLVFAKVRGLFGGDIHKVLTGAAPISPEILEFFYGAGITVFEGYGMTESSAAIAITPNGHPRFGTVGTAIAGTEVRIAEDGEVLAKGPNVFAGYFDNPEETAATIIDGWLHTGDLGELDADGYLTITGRKKDLIITAGGKNLSPANLENGLTSSRWIAQAVMHGDRRPYPVALITLDPEEIVPYAAENGLPEQMSELVEHEKIRALIQGELDVVNAQYSNVSQIKKFVLLDRELTQEGGELTPTMKIKRNVVEKKYAEVFDSMYTSAKE